MSRRWFRAVVIRLTARPTSPLPDVSLLSQSPLTHRWTCWADGRVSRLKRNGRRSQPWGVPCSTFLNQGNSFIQREKFFLLQVILSENHLSLHSFSMSSASAEVLTSPLFFTCSRERSSCTLPATRRWLTWRTPTQPLSAQPSRTCTGNRPIRSWPQPRWDRLQRSRSHELITVPEISASADGVKWLMWCSVELTTLTVGLCVWWHYSVKKRWNRKFNCDSLFVSDAREWESRSSAGGSGWTAGAALWPATTLTSSQEFYPLWTLLISAWHHFLLK